VKGLPAVVVFASVQSFVVAVRDPESMRRRFYVRRQWQHKGLCRNDDVVWQNGSVHSEYRRHKGHVVIAPDPTMIIDNVRGNPDDPERDVDTNVFTVTRYKLDSPGLWRCDGSRRGST
jgi:hypothetical protein